MKIKYLGHSCFQIFSETQSVVIDPYSDGSVPGLNPLRVKANAVYCSHQHADHNGVSCVEFDEQGALRGPNTIQVFECEDKHIAHLGDLGCDLDDEQRAQLQDLDVLMIPVGGYFTIDAKQAAKIVLDLKPKCVIPMHYKGENFGYDVLATVDDFLALVPGAQKIDADEIELTDAKGLIILKFN